MSFAGLRNLNSVMVMGAGSPGGGSRDSVGFKPRRSGTPRGRKKSHRLAASRFRMQPMRRIHFIFLALCLGSSLVLHAQDAPSKSPDKQASETGKSGSKTAAETHHFWDWQNDCLFAGVGAARMLDYASTRHFRDQGNNEWLLTNGIVDNKPLFVGIELAGTAASIGVSYLFHRTGHHSLERWVSVAHIGVAVGGSIHNYSLKPPPTASSIAIASQ